MEVSWRIPFGRSQSFWPGCGAFAGRCKPWNERLKSELGCADVLQLITSIRGAVNGLMAEVIEDHIQFHVIAPSLSARVRDENADELIEVVRSYLR